MTVNDAPREITSSWLDAALGSGVRVHDLGRPLFKGMPQSPNHPPYWHTLPRRHGDMVRADGGSAAADHISLGTHVGTHIDAFSHVSHDGELLGGISAEEAQRGGAMKALGAETIAPMFRRGVLLDVPRALGLEQCEPGYEITPDDLHRTVEQQGVEIRPGDVVLIRSGWGANFDAGAEVYTGHASGVPGVSEAGAYWLADRQVHAAGADTIAFERLLPGQGHALLPAHRVLLVEKGIHIIETMDLEELGAAGVHEFLFVLSPLKLVGATGSPVRPLAVVPEAGS
ncbi:Kynurenine formamidase [Pseudonocardia thermophila]|jgi:Predicted metal-dependent hydrolase|uniref:Kynurenine formamidase n=1 Tax=Pseudonocardia thermophila TaxID=1848 RepID=A0A1M6ZWT2_PSETH|nr:cyclase family protein [Pseudonocardia thermophila]SHL34870.1 Kynurenine formamidase [Pseudonocardia thermophila]